MKDRLLRYAIAIGDEWFTGFKWDSRGGDHRVGRESTCMKLLEEDSLRLAMEDLGRCGFFGDVYEVEVTRLSSGALGRRLKGAPT